MKGTLTSKLLVAGILLGFPVLSIVFSKLGLKEGLKKNSEISQYLDYEAIPNFSLTNQMGKMVTREDLEKKTVIISLFSSQAQEATIAATKQMRRIQNEYRKNPNAKILMLSITTTPEVDTPRLLRHYAWQYGADSTYWNFVTGNKADILQLVNNDLHISIQEGAKAPEMITNSSKLILIDLNGKIRNYYDGTDPNSVSKMIEDIAYITPRKKQETIEYKPD